MFFTPNCVIFHNFWHFANSTREFQHDHGNLRRKKRVLHTWACVARLLRVLFHWFSLFDTHLDIIPCTSPNAWTLPRRDAPMISARMHRFPQSSSIKTNAHYTARQTNFYYREKFLHSLVLVSGAELVWDFFFCPYQYQRSGSTRFWFWTNWAVVAGRCGCVRNSVPPIRERERARVSRIYMFQHARAREYRRRERTCWLHETRSFRVREMHVRAQ